MNRKEVERYIAETYNKYGDEQTFEAVQEKAKAFLTALLSD